jgi:hypothetical protein
VGGREAEWNLSFQAHNHFWYIQTTSKTIEIDYSKRKEIESVSEVNNTIKIEIIQEVKHIKIIQANSFPVAIFELKL